MASVSQQIYDDSASLGRTMTFIGKIILSVLGVIGIISGVALMFSKDTAAVQGQKQVSNKWRGAGFILMGLLLIGMGFLVDYMAHKYKFFAAGEGVGTVFNMFRR